MSEGLQIEILKSVNNPLLNRKEYMIRLIHIKSSTPSRDQVRTLLASKLGTSIDRVIVKSLKTHYGTNITLCKAHIYDSPEKIIEPEYIKLRNLPRAERKKVLESMKAGKTEVKQEPKAK